MVSHLSFSVTKTILSFNPSFLVTSSFISFFWFFSFRSSETSKFFLASSFLRLFFLRLFVTNPSPPPVTLTPNSKFQCLATGRWPTLMMLETVLLFYPLVATMQSVYASFLILAEETTTPFYPGLPSTFLLFLSVTTIRSRRSLYCGCFFIPLRYKSTFGSSRSSVHLKRTAHSAVLRHMLLGILVQPSNHIGSEPWHQSQSSPFFRHFHRHVQDFTLVSKKSKHLRQLSSFKCSLIGAPL